MLKKFLILSLFLLASCKAGDIIPVSEDTGVYKGKMYEDHTMSTPKGATIAAKFSIRPELGPLVDEGIADLNRIASAPPNNYNVSDMPANIYRVWLFPRSPKCENPAFLVDGTGSPYEGSEWDKDPSPNRCLLCAAGMMVLQQSGAPGMLITDDPGIMRTIVRYEGEHNVLYRKDLPRYAATQYHGAGQGHPILGEGEGNLVQGPTYKHASVGDASCVLLTK